MYVGVWISKSVIIHIALCVNANQFYLEVENVQCSCSEVLMTNCSGKERIIVSAEIYIEDIEIMSGHSNKHFSQSCPTFQKF